jgi:RNA polymerase sigma-70 factor (ECF subfamily)
MAVWLKSVAKSQDRDAFARLHRHFAPRIASWLLRAGLSETQVEDLVQETMLSVWRKAPLYDPAYGRVSTWIFVIARNLRVDFSRRKERRDLAPLDDWDAIDEQPNGEGRMIAAENEIRVREALEQLSSEQAQVLVHAYFSEKPQSAIAKELGVPLGTVKSRVRSALAKLRALLEDAQ